MAESGKVPGDYRTGITRQGLARRSVLRLGVSGAASMAVIAILNACGGDTNAPTATSNVVPATTGAAAKTTPAVASPSQQAGSATQGKPGGKLVIGMNMEPDTMDQHVGSSRYNEFVNINIYDRLIEQADDGSYKPGLAQSWAASPDGLTWTLKLRDGVKFHDGTPFTADVVKFNFDRMADPATKSQKSGALLGPYQGTEVVDDHTVNIKMKTPYAPFVNALSSLYLVMESPAAIKKSGADYGQHPVGTGPYMFKEWVQKDHITLVRNPDFNWASSVFKHSGPAYLDELTFRFIPEDATRSTTLETGETDVIINLPPQDYDRFHAGPKFATIVSPVLGLPPSIIVNTERPPTDDPKVRTALQYAVDQAGLIKTVFYGVYERAYGPLAQQNQYYDKSVESAYSYNPQKAKAILDEAGWAVGAGGIRQKNGQPLKMVYIAFPGGTSIQTAELVQSQLRSVGIDVTINQLNNPANLSASQAGEHHLRWLNWLFGDASELSTTFSSQNIGTGWNFARWKNPELDMLLDQGKTELDDQKRAQIYSKIQHIIMDNQLIVPLYVGSQVLALKSSVKGIRMHPLGDTAMFYDAYLS